ncbi:CAP domain-containing protein [Alkaliphilus peptidifermentans]|uniref:Uncharacterized conserved protein YkwD, contains CAP (CSP/antigen 5/PR1) domain n=1 Tax=Alkaliphilus peptidifermentans DSM 18978 TaxID=1120976 RepID=A0A1G5H4G9_9FIRM|nr:CAP domain-containing protein [Alkaliphilus peptidifermentans]SCY57838.1 Uncharacterized conserved protein YkwD, contains CAP (CSP/antigen 5/PR1) domain [Alkaliphilus peptidifermentans DSM 18978]
MKKTLRRSFTVVVLSAFIIQSTSMAYASWGLERLLSQQSQTAPIAPSQQKNVQPPQKSSLPNTSQSSNNPTTADLIRSMRGLQSVNQGDSINTTPSPLKPKTVSPPTVETNASNSEETMLKMINQERSKNGLEPLQWHSGLADLAKKKSADMIKNNYFAHNSPTYGSFYQMVYNSGIPFSQVGENLAKGRDVQKAHVLLMASQGHRDNILSTSFTHIGLGITTDEYGIVVTQLFIKQ